MNGKRVAGKSRQESETKLVDQGDHALRTQITVPSALTPGLTYALAARSLLQENSPFVFASASSDSLYQGLTQLLLSSAPLLFSLKSNFEMQVEAFCH